jgi:hypothetical protein
MSTAVHQISSHSTPTIPESLSPDQARVVAALAQGHTVTRASAAAGLSAAALKTLRTLLEAPETHPAVRLKTALAILERPGFPSPGWQLPAEIASPRERRTIDELSLMEADYRRLRMTEAVLRSEARNGSKAEPCAAAGT